jgi:hypothetical protein
MTFDKSVDSLVGCQGEAIVRTACLDLTLDRSSLSRAPESTAMVDVVSEIIIERSTADVARYAVDPDNAPRWYVNIKSVDWKTTPPLQIGSEVAFVAEFLGRRIAYTYRVIDFESERRLVMQTAEGPFPMETTYEFEAVSGGGTRMRLRNRGRPSGFSSLVAPFMRWSIQRANRKDLAQLKEILERPIKTTPKRG